MKKQKECAQCADLRVLLKQTDVQVQRLQILLSAAERERDVAVAKAGYYEKSVQAEPYAPMLLRELEQAAKRIAELSSDANAWRAFMKSMKEKAT